MRRQVPQVGDEVEILEEVPISSGSIVSLQVGDRGTVEGVSGDYCKVRVSGYAMLVKASVLNVVTPTGDPLAG